MNVYQIKEVKACKIKPGETHALLLSKIFEDISKTQYNIIDFNMSHAIIILHSGIIHANHGLIHCNKIKYDGGYVVYAIIESKRFFSIQENNDFYTVIIKEDILSIERSSSCVPVFDDDKRKINLPHSLLEILIGKKSYQHVFKWLLRDNQHTSEQHNLVNLVSFSLLTALVVPFFVAEYMYFQLERLMIGLITISIIMIGAPCIYRFTGKFCLAREAFIGSLFLFNAVQILEFGDIISPGTIWFASLPMIAILLGSIISACMWMILSTITILYLHAIIGPNIVFTASYAPAPHFMFITSLIALTSSMATFVIMVEMSRKKAIANLQEANNKINHMALRDPLTGIYNRRYMWGEISKEQNYALATQNAFCICMLDIDFFKKINDTYGHATGDKVLVQVANIIEGQVRQGDCAGRYGGEEFICLLKNTDVEGAMQFAERVRSEIAQLQYEEHPDMKVSISAGVAQYNLLEEFSLTVERADKALYAAKTNGRNRVILAA